MDVCEHHDASTAFFRETRPWTHKLEPSFQLTSLASAASLDTLRLWWSTIQAMRAESSTGIDFVGRLGELAKLVSAMNFPSVIMSRPC